VSSGAARRRAVATLAALGTLACGSDTPSPTDLVPTITVLTGPDLPQGTAGVPYDVTLQATGGTGQFTWHVMNPPLPPGLTLAESGRLSGTPQLPVTTGLSVRVTSGPQARTVGFMLTVARAPLEISPPQLAPPTLGVAYSQFLEVIGGSGAVQWTLASGALPRGLALSPAGLLAGTPTALDSTTFRVRATRGVDSAERSYALRVVPAPLVVTTTSLPSAKVGDAYSAQLESSGGSGGNQWTLSQGALPPGLQLTAAGTIAGTPTVAGDFSFTVQVASAAQQAARAFILTVVPAGFPSAATVTMPGNVFVPFLVQIARGGMVTWVFGAVPHNVIFASATGAPADINIVSNVPVTRTFATIGTFRYDCTIHPGMSGVVEVKP
jgi:large repetitive protein